MPRPKSLAVASLGHMRVTFLGHAGLFIETRAGTVLCDPWFTPAFFGSWFPFPRNDHLDRTIFANPDYVYISHEHRDHFDPAVLREVSKRAIVLLPDFALSDHEVALRRLGFHHFIRCRTGAVQDLDGLRVAIDADTDEPTGDSALMLDDGEARLLNQNDARPLHLDTIAAFGPFDAHFLQFSGAMWFPAVYRWSASKKAEAARATRLAQARRATAYVRGFGARHVFPSAGPPCFLDPTLFYLNDLPGNPEGIFPDQATFVAHLESEGVGNAHIVFPGSVIDLAGGACSPRHPGDANVLRATIFEGKREYLEQYARDVRPVIAADKARRRVDGLSIVAGLAEWLNPLLRQAAKTCDGVGGRVLLDCGDEAVVIDFPRRRVESYDGDACAYRFFIPRWLMEAVLRERPLDWVNSVFLSCRFEADRDGAYNEWVYSFFKGLSPERLRHLEFVYGEPPAPDDDWECHGYMVQRRCPHFKADLKRFATVEDGVLTCTMHGWRFHLATGRCLTAEGRSLRTRPIRESPADPVPGGGEERNSRQLGLPRADEGAGC